MITSLILMIYLIIHISLWVMDQFSKIKKNIYFNNLFNLNLLILALLKLPELIWKVKAS